MLSLALLSLAFASDPLVPSPAPSPAPASAPAPAPPASLAAAPAAPDDPLAAFASVPEVGWRTPDALDEAWRDLRRRKDGGPVARVRAFGDEGFERAACDGLVHLRALDAAKKAGFLWQGDIAGREWARPSLARVLVTAHTRWRARHPGQALGIGDIAQAGCGQVDPGTLTRWVTAPDDLAALARDARPVAGLLTATTFEGAGRNRLMIERRIVGRAPGLAAPAADGAAPGLGLFVRMRRYRDAGPSPAAALEAKVRAIVDKGDIVIATSGPGPDGALEHRQHIVDAAGHRQAVVVSRVPLAKGTTFHLADARDIGLSPWAPARPGETRYERRFVREDAADGKPRWVAWEILEEGAHVTHMAGRDADLSYPMKVPSRRFATDPDGIDYAAAWDWFETLVATAAELGTPIDRLVVGGRVLPRLLAANPHGKSSRLVRDKLFKVVANHDDHQHIRLAVPSPEAEADAARALAPR